MNEPKAFTGTVKGGKFEADDTRAFVKAFVPHEGRKVVLWVKRWQKLRSTGREGEADYNGYYWSTVIFFWMEKMGIDDAKMMHEVLKTMYNFKPVLIGDEVIRVPLSTVMESGEFWAFIERCRKGYSETFGGEIPDPNEGLSQRLMAEYAALGNARSKV